MAIVLFFLGLIAIICLPLFLIPSFSESVIFSLVSFILYLLLSDMAFRFLVRRWHGDTYKMINKVPFDRIYVEPHPYLPYVYKKNFLGQKKEQANYPLGKDRKYVFGELYTNNLRHINGIDGSRDVVIPKPKGLFRINCLGASASGNYIFENGKGFSYPLELEKILQNCCSDKNIEVNNCGMGGYTTAEILIKFLLNSIDTNPDMIVFYHAYNDLRPSLTRDFQSDYSHAFRNLGETLHLFKWASKFPSIPLALPNYLFNLILAQNIRYGLIEAVSKGSVDLKAEFRGLETYRRNIENLIHICNGSGIKLVLSTYCHFLYPEIESSELHQKYQQGVLAENEVIQELAAKYDLSLVDNFNLVPREEKYFLDSIHLSPEGMREIAENISKPIIEYMNSIK